MKKIRIRYYNRDLVKIEKIVKGDWIDLRAAETISMVRGEYCLISRGIAMELPIGYEAHIVPRSSTFKKHHILQANSKGIIDNSYCGDNDVWRFPAYAVRDTKIFINDRICQFRITKIQPDIEFIEVDKLDNESRGGFGSTGVN